MSTQNLANKNAELERERDNLKTELKQVREECNSKLSALQHEFTHMCFEWDDQNTIIELLNLKVDALEKERDNLKIELSIATEQVKTLATVWVQSTLNLN